MGNKNESQTILNDIKILLGITTEDTSFDKQILLHINSVVMILRQLGIGPNEGYTVTESSLWSDYLENENQYESTKSYMFVKVKQLFDPVNNGTIKQAMDEASKEMEFRLNYDYENQ